MLGHINTVLLGNLPWDLLGNLSGNILALLPWDASAFGLVGSIDLLALLGIGGLTLLFIGSFIGGLISSLING